MPILQTSEIFLIILVISLWLLSVLLLLHRYSLFLCFHKRDVPFYNVSLIDDKPELQSPPPPQPPPQPPPSASAIGIGGGGGGGGGGGVGVGGSTNMMHTSLSLSQHPQSPPNSPPPVAVGGVRSGSLSQQQPLVAPSVLFGGPLDSSVSYTQLNHVEFAANGALVSNHPSAAAILMANSSQQRIVNTPGGHITDSRMI